MPRNPNDPIPGFPEFTGTVGKEKRVHKTHFQVKTDKTWRGNSGRWVYIGVGRYRLASKEEGEQHG